MLFDITKSEIDFKEVDTVDGFIFVGTNFRGLNRNDIRSDQNSWLLYFPS